MCTRTHPECGGRKPLRITQQLHVCTTTVVLLVEAHLYARVRVCVCFVCVCVCVVLCACVFRVRVRAYVLGARTGAGQGHHLTSYENTKSCLASEKGVFSLAEIAWCLASAPTSRP